MGAQLPPPHLNARTSTRNGRTRSNCRAPLPQPRQHITSDLLHAAATPCTRQALTADAAIIGKPGRSMLARALQLPRQLAGARRCLATQAWPSFRAADLLVEQQQAAAPPPQQLSADLAFGKVFTPHMLLVSR